MRKSRTASLQLFLRRRLPRLASLWSGYTPAEHGFCLAINFSCASYGARANMIAFSPVATADLGAQQLVDADSNLKIFADSSLPQALDYFGIPVLQFHRSAVHRDRALPSSNFAVSKKPSA